VSTAVSIAVDGDRAVFRSFAKAGKTRRLRRKHPFLHGLLVPLTHRIGRARTGRTVHYELVDVTAR
jgi:hypothetical protein